MVLGYHLVWTAYGWWLPNDPRGSGSLDIRVAELAPLGDLHHGRKEAQPSRRELRDFLAHSEELLQHQKRLFTPEDIQTIANSFAQVIRDNRYACHACAIMPEHVHLLMGRRRALGETMAEQFQQASRNALIAADGFAATHPVWTAGQRVLFKSSIEAMFACIQYIERNPLEIGWPEQRWDFVTAYDPSFRPF